MIQHKQDQRVDAFIQALPAWQRAFAEQVRVIVHAADPAVQETIKRSTQPYFTLDGNICAFLSAKDHLNIFIYDPIAPDPNRLINQGQGNRTARAIQLYEGDEINEPALLKLFQDVIANNRRGGWRTIQRNS